LSIKMKVSNFILKRCPHNNNYILYIIYVCAILNSQYNTMAILYKYIFATKHNSSVIYGK